MEQASVTAEEYEKMREQNPSLPPYEDDDEPPVNPHDVKDPEPVQSGWKHTIVMGLISGLLWAISLGSGIGGVLLTVMGITKHNGWQTGSGVFFLVAAVTLGVCAKIFHDKVKYGEV